ncbi:MAG: VacJ family lipoprotein [Rhodospirillales bacterium]|jgi:phospholipid-binding lipoprotein MlaA|nr:VacJ family lipoprotein [Rhodospirillales bacterium]
MTKNKKQTANMGSNVSDRDQMKSFLKNGFRFKAAKLLCGTMLVGCLAFNTADTASADGFSTIQPSEDYLNQYQEFVVNSQLAEAGYGTSYQLSQSDEDVNDPLEGFNRAMFGFNQGFYDVILGPMSDAYNVLPSHARSMIGGVLSNLSAPVVFINDVLQGEPLRAFTTARRFVVNSLFGFGGIADVASSFGLEEHDEDFGQTMAVWGVGEGPYLVLPILGPGNPRDSIGRFLVDPWMDPVGNYLDNHDRDNWIWYKYGINAVHDFSIIRDDLNQLESTSVDYYAAVRSLYRQKRNVAISNGDEMELPAIPDFEFGNYPNGPAHDPSIGDADGSKGDDDQVSSLAVPELGKGDLMISDPFSARFEPVEYATIIIDSSSSAAWNTPPHAPRKPTYFEHSTEVAEVVVIPDSYDALAYGAK